MSDTKKFGWPLSLLPFHVGDKVTITDTDGKQYTGIVTKDGAVRGEPICTIADHLTLNMIIEEDGVDE